MKTGVKIVNSEKNFFFFLFGKSQENIFGNLFIVLMFLREELGKWKILISAWIRSILFSFQLKVLIFRTQKFSLEFFDKLSNQKIHLAKIFYPNDFIFLQTETKILLRISENLLTFLERKFFQEKTHFFIKREIFFWRFFFI